MPTYVVGDIHGCWDAFRALLTKIDFVADRDRLLLVGDLVNRGPGSLQVLRWVHGHRESIRLVLGNHDLHLLARWVGAARVRREDSLAVLFSASDHGRLLQWLRTQPLLVEEAGRWIVHAGLHPAWDEDRARAEADAVHRRLAGDDFRRFLADLYRRPPSRHRWHLGREDAALAAASVFTRIRMVDGDGEPRLRYTGRPELKRPQGWRPWYECSPVVGGGREVIFGHWAQLGHHRAGPALCLDSACVYGGRLSALRLDDDRLFSVGRRARGR